MKCITAETFRTASWDLNGPWVQLDAVEMWMIGYCHASDRDDWHGVNRHAAEIAESLKYGGEDIP